MGRGKIGSKKGRWKIYHIKAEARSIGGEEEGQQKAGRGEKEGGRRK